MLWVGEKCTGRGGLVVGYLHPLMMGRTDIGVLIILSVQRVGILVCWWGRAHQLFASLVMTRCVRAHIEDLELINT